MKFDYHHSQPAFIIASFAVLASAGQARAYENYNANDAIRNRIHFFIQDQDVGQNGGISFSQSAQQTSPKPTNNTPIATTHANQTNTTSNLDDRVLLVADEVVSGDTQNEIIAIGNVEARNKGRRLLSDKLVYNRDTGIVTAVGNVTIIEADGTVSFADEVTVDDQLNSGLVNNFAARFPNNGVVAATTAVKEDGGRNSLSRVKYTACPVCAAKPEPTWNIRARKAIQDTQKKEISYQDVVFEVKGVPVFYTPYFKHGDPTAGRQSGLLQSKPGRSSRLGYNLEQPYLYVIDDYSDITISPQISQYVNPIVFGDYRRKFYSGDLHIAGSVTNEKFFAREGYKFGNTDWRGHIFADGKFNINDTWDWGFGVENASDDLYLARYSIRGQGTVRGPVRITSNSLINQLYLEGKESDFYARVMGIGFQNLQGFAYRKNTPKVLPDMELHKVWQTDFLNGTIGANTSGVYLARNDDKLDSGRFSSSVNWRGQKIIGNGFLLKPSAEIKGDYFYYNHFRDASGNDVGTSNFSRFNANVATDFSIPLQRYTQNYKIILEPKLNLRIATTNDKSDQVVIEDAYNYENSYSSYFYNDVSAINDIYDSGASATLGMNLAVYDNSNNSINWFVGKQYRNKNNPLYNPLSNLDSKNGDYVSNLEIDFKKFLTLSGNVRIDGDTGELIRTEVSANINYKNLSVQTRYHELPQKYSATNANRELITSAQYKLGDYTLFADNWHDFKTDTNLKSRFGVSFGDACTDIRIYYEEINTTNRFVTPSKNFKIQIAFKTLGVIDDDPFE